ncbi:MAG: heparan-alpha-glucosaminide N-acetyltransferase [Bacillota bacterium]
MNKNNRIWEIDFLRGTAIILMALFHLFYDLKEFYGYNFEYQTGIIYYMGKLSALMFIMLTGISCSFSKNNLKRGIRALFYALIITIVTYIYDPNTYVNFGILHFLATCIILYKFFRPLNNLSLFSLGTLIILTGYIINQFSVSSNIIVPFGLTSNNYTSLDYYPLFPYLGVFLYGIAMKRFLYPANKSLLNPSLNFKTISYLGKHSLFIYLVHQPIILGALKMLRLMDLI